MLASAPASGAMQGGPEWTTAGPLPWLVAAFRVARFVPVEDPRLQSAIHQALALTRCYDRERVLLCLIPAFSSAGALSVFVSQQSVIRYPDAQASRPAWCGGANVSGSVLAVCSWAVLPLFASSWGHRACLWLLAKSSLDAAKGRSPNAWFHPELL